MSQITTKQEWQERVDGNVRSMQAAVNGLVGYLMDLRKLNADQLPEVVGMVHELAEIAAAYDRGEPVARWAR